MGSGRIAVAALLAAGLIGALPVARGASEGGEIVFARTGVLQPRAELFSIELGRDPRKLGGKLQEGSSTLGGVSADGRRIAFVSARRDASDLYVVGVDGTGLRRIARDVAKQSRVSWSPDGKWLAFEGRGAGVIDVQLVRADGARRRTLLRGARGPAWSPDGSRIAVQTGAGMVVLRPDGRRLWTAPGSEAVWSPDGSRLAVERYSDTLGPLTAVLDADGATRASVVGSLAAWSPDGGRVVVVRLGGGGPDGTFVFQVDSARPPRRVGPFGSGHDWSRAGHLAFQAEAGDDTVWVLDRGARTARPRLQGYLVGYSDDGRRLAALSTLSSQVELVVAEANGANPRRVVPAPPLGSRFGETHSWAGSGTVVYQQTRTSADGDLYLARPDGTGLRQLTGTRERDSDPDWSPDGSTVVFSRSTLPFDEFRNSAALWTLPAGGGQPTRLTSPRGDAESPRRDVDSGADWSPDGTRVVFVRERGSDTRLFVVSADGTGLTQLDTASDTARAPSWSPDGMRIAFADRSQTGFQIAVIAPDGSGRRTLIPAREGVDLGNPAWSPDGQSLAFDDGESVFVARTDGKQIRRVTSGHGPVAWSPDGTRLIYALETEGRAVGAPANLWSVARDGTGRARVTRAVARDTNPDWRP